MFWFGILEDLDRSLELLSFQLNLPHKSLTLPKSNSNRAPSAKPSAESVEKLESLMPQDMWVYEYAKRVFEARWEYFKTGSFKPPNRPPFPKVQCRSTRFILKCTGGPYKGENASGAFYSFFSNKIRSDLLYQWDSLITDEHKKEFADLLQPQF